MARLRTPLLVLIFFTVLACNWTTLAPIPKFSPYCTSAELGESVLFVGQDALLYSSLSDTWTTVSPMPISTPDAAAVSIESHILTSYQKNIWTFSASGEWTTKTLGPTVQWSSGMAARSDKVWRFGSMHLHEYNAVADTWTTRSAPPTHRTRNRGAYYQNTVVVVGGEYVPTSGTMFRTELYHILTDAWTTGAPTPSNRHWFTMIGISGDRVYVGGGTSGAVCEVYTITTDAWHTIDSVPKAFADGTGATSLVGYFMTFGPSTWVHGYRVFLYSAVIGDPLFSTFSGQSYHLDLYPGLFNLLLTPKLAVNIVVDTLPHMTPEEDTFITMVGIVAELSSGLHTFDCASLVVSNVCKCHMRRCLECNTEVSFFENLTIEGDELQVKIVPRSVTVVNDQGRVLGSARHLNLEIVLRDVSLAPLSLADGLLVSLDSRGLADTQAALARGDYTVHSGCLFAADFAAAVGHGWHTRFDVACA